MASGGGRFSRFGRRFSQFFALREQEFPEFPQFPVCRRGGEGFPKREGARAERGQAEQGVFQQFSSVPFLHGEIPGGGASFLEKIIISELEYSSAGNSGVISHKVISPALPEGEQEQNLAGAITPPVMLYRVLYARDQLRWAISMLMLSGPLMKAIFTPGRISQGSQIHSAPFSVNSFCASSMSSTKSPK